MTQLEMLKHENGLLRLLMFLVHLVCIAANIRQLQVYTFALLCTLLTHRRCCIMWQEILATCWNHGWWRCMEQRIPVLRWLTTSPTPRLVRLWNAELWTVCLS